MMCFRHGSIPLELLKPMLSFVGGILGATSEGAGKIVLYFSNHGVKCCKRAGWGPWWGQGGRDRGIVREEGKCSNGQYVGLSLFQIDLT